MLLVFVKFLHDLNQGCGTDVFLIKSCPAVGQALDLTIIKIDFKGKEAKKEAASGFLRRTVLPTCF
jgi:hypothetical protein